MFSFILCRNIYRPVVTNKKYTVTHDTNNYNRNKKETHQTLKEKQKNKNNHEFHWYKKIPFNSIVDETTPKYKSIGHFGNATLFFPDAHIQNDDLAYFFCPKLPSSCE
jgi:hypothetical protein